MAFIEWTFGALILLGLIGLCAALASPAWTAASAIFALVCLVNGLRHPNRTAVGNLGEQRSRDREGCCPPVASDPNYDIRYR